MKLALELFHDGVVGEIAVFVHGWWGGDGGWWGLGLFEDEDALGLGWGRWGGGLVKVDQLLDLDVFKKTFLRLAVASRRIIIV